MPKILLLASDERHALLEKRALRDMGVSSLDFMDSGMAAARLLADEPSDELPDVIICSQQLHDISGDCFCNLLRLHPRLNAVPTLLILSNDTEVEHCKTLGFKASAVLGRPYSTEKLKDLVFSLAAARPKLATPSRTESGANETTSVAAFEKALAASPAKQERRPEDYYRVGRQSLLEGRWNDAIGAFHMTLDNAPDTRESPGGQSLNGEAELGLAAAWKKKGDIAQSNRHLANAAENFVRTGQWKRARTVYSRLLRERPSAKNPFLAQAQQALRQKRHADAARYLAEGFELTPDRLAYDKIAQICLSDAMPDDMLRDMESALIDVMGERGTRLAEAIRKRYQTLHEKRETWRREAEAERRRKVALLLGDREETLQESPAGTPSDDGTAPDNARAGMRTGKNGPAGGRNAGAPNWRELTAPLTADVQDDENTPDSGGDLLSIIKYTWKLAKKCKAL
ncbi:MAG: response regulator [Desulfovibrio sp.]|jgi:CheY-like chemotaxis protein|nr:response regulator [Desulfovibrio sp.]